MKKTIKYTYITDNFTSTYIFYVLFIGIINSGLFVSCTTDSDLETPGSTPKLVLHSFISPNDSFVRVNVSTTRNIFGKIEDYGKDLPVTVTFIDGDNIMPLALSDTAGTYSVRYKVNPGQEYQIKASCEGYPEVSAFCRVPDSNDFSISIDTLIETVDYSYYEPAKIERNKVLIKFNDIPNQNNYYNIFCNATSFFQEVIFSKDEFLKSPDSLNYTFELDVEYDEEYKRSNLLSDNLMDGEPIVSTFIAPSDFYSRSDSFRIEAWILETDVNYYKYHSSLSKYEDSGNPFVEFSPVYSNINGGFGIFASYIMHKKIFSKR